MRKRTLIPILLLGLFLALACTISISDAASVQVISPNGGETLQTGNPVTIRWKSSGMTGNVRVVLRKGGRFLKGLHPRGGAPNTGQFSWTIPTSLAASSDYQIRIRGLDAAASVMDDSDRYFSIAPLNKTAASTVMPKIIQPVAKKKPGSTTGLTDTEQIKKIPGSRADMKKVIKAAPRSSRIRTRELRIVRGPSSPGGADARGLHRIRTSELRVAGATKLPGGTISAVGTRRIRTSELRIAASGAPDSAAEAIKSTSAPVRIRTPELIIK